MRIVIITACIVLLSLSFVGSVQGADIELNDDLDVSELNESETQALIYLLEAFDDLEPNSTVDPEEKYDYITEVERHLPKPQLSIVSQEPTVPESDEEVTVKYRISDPGEWRYELGVLPPVENASLITVDVEETLKKDITLTHSVTDPKEGVLEIESADINSFGRTYSPPAIDSRSPGDRTIYQAELAGYAKIDIDIDIDVTFPIFGNFSFSFSDFNVPIEEVSDSTERRDYFTFENVQDVAVLYGEWGNHCAPRSSEQPQHRHNNLSFYQQNVSDHINRYMASNYGSMGGVGYDLTHFDDGGTWIDTDYCAVNYEIGGDFSKYDEDARWFWPQRNFTQDVVDSFVESSNYQDEESFDGGNSDGGEFDRTVVVSPGDQENNTNHDFKRANYFPEQDRIYLNEMTHSPNLENFDTPGSEGTWVHELGHSIGFGDLYDPVPRQGGDGTEANTAGVIGYHGMMGNGSAINAPFSIVTRTEHHTLWDGLECGSSTRDECPWLDTIDHIGAPPINNTEKLAFKIDSIEALEYNSTVHTWNFNGNGDPLYIFGAKGSRFVEPIKSLSGITSVRMRDKGVNVYRVDRIEGTNRISLLQNPMRDFQWWNQSDQAPINTTMEEEFQVLRIPTPDTKALFQISEIDGSAENYRPVVQIEEADTRNSDLVEITLNTTPLEQGAFVQGQDIAQPGLDVHAYDTEGQHVGPNYTTGTIDTEIQGVTASNVYPRGITSWAELPEGTLARYEVDTRGMEDYYDRLEEDSDPSSSDLNSTQVSLDLTLYGNNSWYNESTGSVQDTTTFSLDTSVERNTSTTVASAATVDFHPETFNLASSGRWVTVSLEIPHEEVDVEDILVSSVTLNGEVPAVDDNRYGFVRNPTSDSTFMAKFPAAAVADILETGEEVKVTITGETTEGEAVFGHDTVRVIDEGAGRITVPTGPTDGTCSKWTTGVGRLIPGLIDCPPGLGGTVPGGQNRQSVNQGAPRAPGHGVTQPSVGGPPDNHIDNNSQAGGAHGASPGNGPPSTPPGLQENPADPQSREENSGKPSSDNPGKGSGEKTQSPSDSRGNGHPSSNNRPRYYPVIP